MEPTPSRNGNPLLFLDGIQGEKGRNGAVGKKTTKKVSRGGGAQEKTKAVPRGIIIILIIK